MAHGNGTVIRGDILYPVSQKELAAVQGGYLVIADGLCEGVFDTLPGQYGAYALADYAGHLVIPGMVDLHLHAPQYPFRGMWMDEELITWLNRHAFPMEARYADPVFAETAYRAFAEDLTRSATTRAVVFSTIHTDTTLCLMELMERTGLVSFVGKVNMDRNSPENLQEESAKASLAATEAWLAQAEGRFRRTKPVLTPRFIPSCSEALLEGLGRLATEKKLPVQSHLSENHREIEWVKELCPWSDSYGQAYDRFGLFGEHAPAVMAHCVHSTEAEIALMKARGTFIAHCPDSNCNLASGIAPVRRYLEEGLRVGLGSDVAGGSTLSMFAVIRDALQHSKLRWRLVDEGLERLSFAEAFSMATMGGGAFFGRVGSFLAGYEADVLVLDESAYPTPLMGELTLTERLERMVYLGSDRDVLHKYVQGNKLF